MRRVLLRTALAVVTLAAPALTLVGAAPTATALDNSLGYAGVCTGADATTGTTIVVDFQTLNGNGGGAAPTITRCSPNPAGGDRTGVKALQDAGFALTGHPTYGLGFITKIENRPAAADTSPSGSYWSYWHANGTGTSWTYSSYGAGNRKVIPGGFEGWSFSAGSTNPAPGVTPLNPAADAGATRAALQVDDLDRTITLGSSTTLTWSTQNATSVLAQGVTPSGGGIWSGAKATSGTATITPTATGTFTYHLRATGAKGTTTTSATLTVVP
ncbi:hypothetical protein [Nocardioides zeae]|uniref:hypothetical protein n=1 Tax=Nocardioides zeae TaxID=1457234 RepID=UPI0019D652D4|nr:hypothetical protein [Nocardioides zeae]